MTVDRTPDPKPYAWIQPPATSFDTGVVLTNVGDLDGDARDDLVIGAFDDSFAGESWVLRAGTAPLP